MKHRLLIIALFFSLLTFTATAQLPAKQQREDKPFLFSRLSDKIEIPEIFFNQLLALKPGDTFHVSLPGQLEFHGFVLEKVNRAEGSTSMNLRLSNFNDALFNLSITTTSDNRHLIRANILHRRFADALLLRYENGRYFLEKQEQRLVLAE